MGKVLTDADFDGLLSIAAASRSNQRIFQILKEISNNEGSGAVDIVRDAALDLQSELGFDEEYNLNISGQFLQEIVDRLFDR